MGYRYHFYLFNKKEIEQLSEKLISMSNFSDNEVLCIECSGPIAQIWDKCRPLFKKGTGAYQHFEDNEEHPCVITKQRLKEMTLAFYKEYQQYIILESIAVENSSQIPKDKEKLFRRCMHLDEEAETYEKDNQHSMFSGQYLLHQQFLIYCMTEGYNDATNDLSFLRFEKLLDEPNLLNEGNTMYDILMQLVYMYKTFSPSRKLVICGW